MRLAGYKPARREGTREGRWVLLDYVDIVVHIQHQDERNFYALDRLWRDCPLVAGRSRRRSRPSRRHRVSGWRREGAPAGHAAPRPDRVQRRQPHAGPARHRADRPRPRPGRGRRRGAGQASAAADRVLGPAARPRHRRWRSASAAGCRCTVDTRLRETHLGDWQGLTHSEVDADVAGGAAGLARRRHLGPARRREPYRRRRPQPAAGRRTRCRRAGVGRRRPRPAGGAGCPRRSDRRADRCAARPAGATAGRCWAAWATPAGRSCPGTVTMTPRAPTCGGGSTCGTPRPRSPTMSSELVTSRSAAGPCSSSAIRCPTTVRRAVCPPTTRGSGPISLHRNSVGISS